MNAHSFAMLNLCIAFGFALIGSLGIFGASVTDKAGVFGGLAALNNPMITIPGVISITGIQALAGALAIGTIVFLNSNLVTDKGIAMVVYTFIFYGSLFAIGGVLFNLDFPAVGIFYSLYVLLGSLAFIYYLIQMSTGGGKGND